MDGWIIMYFTSCLQALKEEEEKNTVGSYHALNTCNKKNCNPFFGIKISIFFTSKQTNKQKKKLRK
jgi:hypothetical protein